MKAQALYTPQVTLHHTVATDCYEFRHLFAEGAAPTGWGAQVATFGRIGLLLACGLSTWALFFLR